MLTGFATSHGLWEIVNTNTCARLRSSFFAVKWIVFFSLTPHAADGVGQQKEVAVEMLHCGLGVAAQKNRLGFLYCNGTTCISNSAVWDASVRSGYFHNIKRQRGFKSTLAFIVSHEARRRMADCTVQLTGNHTKPASRGTCRATAVKSRPSRMSPYAPARLRRAGRGAGRREEACIQWMQPP